MQSPLEKLNHACLKCGLKNKRNKHFIDRDINRMHMPMHMRRGKLLGCISIVKSNGKKEMPVL